MTVTLYKSTDASAPVLTGAVGTLLTVLDAVLVNGYGSKAAAGWTKPFANSGNIGCYQNSAADGTGFCLNVNDAAPGGGGAREARMTGFETMSALSTGTGQFPLLSQIAIGIGAVVVRKSSTADATARAWTIVADTTTFYLFVETGDLTAPLTVYPFVFGDFISYKTSDPYRCCILGRFTENSTTGAVDPLGALLAFGATLLSNVLGGHFAARSYTGIGGSIQMGKHIDLGKIGGAGNNGAATGQAAYDAASARAIGRAGSMNYPNGPDGGLYLSPIWLTHSNSVRGYLKGVWAPLQDRPLNHNDTYSGAGNLSGKSFLSQSIIVAAAGNASDAGQIHVETSNTWS